MPRCLRITRLAKQAAIVAINLRVARLRAKSQSKSEWHNDNETRSCHVAGSGPAKAMYSEYTCYRHAPLLPNEGPNVTAPILGIGTHKLAHAHWRYEHHVSSSSIGVSSSRDVCMYTVSRFRARGNHGSGSCGQAIVVSNQVTSTKADIPGVNRASLGNREIGSKQADAQD